MSAPSVWKFERCGALSAAAGKGVMSFGRDRKARVAEASSIIWIRRRSVPKKDFLEEKPNASDYKKDTENSGENPYQV